MRWTREPTPPSAPATSAEEARRRAYLAVLAILIPVLAYLVAAKPNVGPIEIGYAVLAAADVGLAVALWTRRVSPRKAEPLMLAPVVVALLGFVVVWRLRPELLIQSEIDIYLAMVWLALAFPLAFLSLGPRRGLQSSLAILATFIAVAVVPAVLTGPRPGLDDPSTQAIISVAAYYAVTLALLRVLSSRLEELTAARTLSQTLATQATTDPLTGLANRRLLDDELDRQIAVARRRSRPLSVVLIDLDHFKSVNDRFGHDTGDQVLIEIARRLRVRSREGDVLGRWGGEELLVLAPGTALEDARGLAERCRARISDTPFPSVGTVTASLGVAELQDDDTARTLLRRADLALYTAKSEGRDRVTALGELGVSPPTD